MHKTEILFTVTKRNKLSSNIEKKWLNMNDEKNNNINNIEISDQRQERRTNKQTHCIERRMSE